MVSASQISGKITGKWKYKLLLITYHGNFKATFKAGGASLAATIPLTSQVVNDRKIPAVTCNSVDLKLDSSKMDITLDGSFISDILGLFVDIF